MLNNLSLLDARWGVMRVFAMQFTYLFIVKMSTKANHNVLRVHGKRKDQFGIVWPGFEFMLTRKRIFFTERFKILYIFLFYR